MFFAPKNRSTTFRIALGFMAVFCVSFLILGIFIFLWSTSYLTAKRQALFESNGTEVADVFRLGGEEALAAEIEQRTAHPESEYIFLLLDRRCNLIAGRPDRQPPPDLLGQRCGELLNNGNWFDFELAPESAGFASNLVLARLVSLSDEYGFLYGGVMQDLDVLEETLLTALLSGFVLVLVLGFGGSVLMSRAISTRLEKLNRTSRQIRRGNLSRRMPVNTEQDEFDRLALNLNEMLDQIESLMEGVKEVSNSIAHDLRTPLTRLNHDLEALRASLPPDAQLQEYVDSAIAEAERMLGTFNALLRIAQIEAGGRRRDFEEINLDHLITDVVEFYWPFAAEKGVTLLSRIDAARTAQGDRNLISQAMSNLVDNAIKYTPPGGTVAVSLRSPTDGHGLHVSDTGPGIPESEHGNVFKRFYRLEADRNLEGSGLGLSLVAAVAKLHGASIELSSADPGLKVSLWLPA